MTKSDKLREHPPESRIMDVVYQEWVDALYQYEAAIMLAKLDCWLELQYAEDEKNGRVDNR